MEHPDLGALSGANEEHNPVDRLVRVTQDDIDRYADVSGDHNPLHVDPGFAATTRFGRTIAHGMMTMAFVLDEAEREFGAEAWATGGEVDVRFRAPVFADDTVNVVGGGGAAPHTIRAVVGDRVCVEAEVTPPRGGGA